jgi:hypothetical protein
MCRGVQQGVSVHFRFQTIALASVSGFISVMGGTVVLAQVGNPRADVPFAEAVSRCMAGGYSKNCCETSYRQSPAGMMTLRNRGQTLRLCMDKQRTR